MHPTPIACVSALVLLWAGPAATQTAAPLLLSPEQYAPARLLPPPPADGSAAAQAERAELHRIQEQRTPAQLAQARSDDSTEDASIFTGALGPRFSLSGLPATAALMAEVRREEQPAAKAAKRWFKRNRPWVGDAAMQSCMKSDAAQTSYPSGHATMAYSMAVVLAALAPERAPALMARADDYAESRLICGMHFRRDVVAGQVLGTVVATDLLADPRFRKDLEAARAELKAAGVVAP